MIPEHVRYFFIICGALDILTIVSHPGAWSIRIRLDWFFGTERLLFLTLMLLLLVEGVLFLARHRLAAYLYYISICLRIPFLTFSFSFLFDIFAIPNIGLLRWVFFILLLAMEFYRLYMTIVYHRKEYLK